MKLQVSSTTIRSIKFILLTLPLSLSLLAQNQINTSVGYRVVIEIPVVNIGTSSSARLVPAVEVYGSGITVDEITPIADRNINHAADETQLIKRIFYVAPNSDIRLGVVNEYRFARGLDGVSIGSPSTSFYKWTGGVTTAQTITIAGTPSTATPDRGFVMTFRTPSSTTPTGDKFGGKTIYKNSDIIATITLRVQVADNINGRQILDKGSEPNFAESAVGMSFGNPIVLNSFQDLLGLQGLIRMFREKATGHDYDAPCYGYLDATSGASTMKTYRETLAEFKAKGIDFSRAPDIETSPQATSEFFASQYYSITEGITLPSSYSGLGQPPTSTSGAISLTNLTSKINSSKEATPFIGMIECGERGSISIQYHDSFSEPYYKLYGFLKLLGDNSSLCVARNIKVQGLIEVNSSDATTSSGRITGGLTAMLNGKNAFLINSVSALSSQVNTGGEAIVGGLVGYMYGDAAIGSYALYDPATPPDPLEELFDHHLQLDNIGSQFRTNSTASSTYLSGGIGYVDLSSNNGGISRLEASIEQGQLLARAFMDTYAAGVVARFKSSGNSSIRGTKTLSTKGFELRASTLNTSTTAANVYASGIAGYLNNSVGNTRLQLYNNALVTSSSSIILIDALDESADGNANMYASGYYGFIENPGNTLLLFRSARSHQEGKLNVSIIQNGYRSTTKAIGGIVAYGLPLLDYPTTPDYLFTLEAKGVNLLIEEKSTSRDDVSRQNSYAALFCGYPNRAIAANDFNKCDFTFTNCTVAITSEFGSKLNCSLSGSNPIPFKYYVGGLLGRTSHTLSTLEGLRLTLDNTHIAAIQNSYEKTISSTNINFPSNLFVGGIVGLCETGNVSSFNNLQKLTLRGKNGSTITADQCALSKEAEPFLGGIVGHCNYTRIVDCTVNGILPSGATRPTESSFGLALQHYNRNNANTPGVGGIVGRSSDTPPGSSSAALSTYSPDDPYNTLAPNQRPCLMARCKVDKTYIYGYGYNNTTASGYDIMIGGLIGVGRSKTDGSVAVLSEVRNSLIVGDGEDKVEVAVGGLSGTDWSGCSGINPIYERCLVHNCRLLAKGQNQWSGAAGVCARNYANTGKYFYSNCLVLDTQIEVQTQSHSIFAGGIYGSSSNSSSKVHMESCFSNAEFIMINPDPSKIYFGGLAAGGYVPNSPTSTTIATSNVVTATNSFFHLQKAGTTDAWSRPTMPNGKGYELDFSNKYLITWDSLAIFNPKTISGASNTGSYNLQRENTGTYFYSSNITYADSTINNDSVMHTARFNTLLSPPSWELRRKPQRPKGSRVPAELWISPWTGATNYKLGEIYRVVVTPDSITQVTPTKAHIFEGIGIAGHEFGPTVESRETYFNDPTPIVFTGYADIEADLGIKPDTANYKDERRVVKWWYSRAATVDGNGKFSTTFLSGSVPVTFVETGYHLTINCTDPILRDEVFYVQTSDFRETKFSTPVKITILYIPPVSITIDPIYGTRPERGTASNPFILMQNSTYHLHSVISPAEVSNSSHFYTLSNVVPSSSLLYITAGGTLFTKTTPPGTTFKISVTTLANKANNTPATDEIYCRIASPVPVSIADDASSIGTAAPSTVIDPLSPYSFRIKPTTGYTYHTANNTPKNARVILRNGLNSQPIEIVTNGVIINQENLLQLPPDFDWTAGTFTINPIVLDSINTQNEIKEIVLDFEYYKQINITFDHNDGKTFYVFSVHEGGQLSQISGLDIHTDPRLHPNFAGLSFKGWLEQRAPTVEFVKGYNIDTTFTASIRLYAILALEFKYGVTHDSYVQYANTHSSLNGALSPPTLTPAERSKPTLGIIKPESLTESNYENLNQVPIVLSNGIRFNIYLSDNKHQPNNILFYSGVNNESDFSSGVLQPITFAFVEKGEQTIQFASGSEKLYYYTYYIPQSELLNLQGKGRLFFVFDNIYKVSHQSIGALPPGATERAPIYYHRDEEIQHSSHPTLANYAYIGWKGATPIGTTGSNYEVGSLMPEQEVVLQGKWAVAQVKNSPSDDFNTTDKYANLFLSLNEAYSATTNGQTLQLMAPTSEDITFDKQIIFDSKFTYSPGSINPNENKINGTVLFAANPNAAASTATAHVQLYHDLVASNVAIQAHTFGNKAQIDFQGEAGVASKIKADKAYLDLSIPTLNTFEGYYAWYPFNLPFDARVNSVTTTANTPLRHPEEFGIAEYSGSRRAQFGIGNTPHLMENDWLYIAPPASAPDFTTRDLTILSQHIGDDQTIAAHTAYMVNNRRKSSTLRFHALYPTFGDTEAASISHFVGFKDEAHNGWNYIAQPLTTNATINANSLPETSTIIQVSNSYSSDIPAAVTPGKQEASYLAIDLATSPNHVIAPYTNFYFQTTEPGTITFAPSNNQADTRSNPSPISTRFGLSLIAPNGTQDNLFLSASTEAEATHYRPGHDLLKIGSRSPHLLQLWSHKGNYDLCAVDAPLNNGEAHIPLTLNLPQADSYRLALNALPSDGSRLWLMQNNRPIIELTNTPNYSLTPQTTGQNNSYSLKLIAPTDRPSDRPHIYGGKGTITIDGLPHGTPYSIVNAAGLVTIEATTHSSPFTRTAPVGVYVVSAAGMHTKVVVE